MTSRILRPYNTMQLLKQSFQLYGAFPLSFLAISVCGTAIPLIFSQLQMIGLEFVFLYLMSAVVEAGVCIILIALHYYQWAPPMQVLKTLGTRVFFGALHIGFLQYLCFTLGITGFFAPAPLNLMFLGLGWIGLYLFSVAQPIFIFQGIPGFLAAQKSLYLTRHYIGKTIAVVTLKALLPILLLNGLATLFPFNLTPLETPEAGTQQVMDIFMEILKEIRWMFYAVFIVIQPISSLMVALLFIDLHTRLFGETNLSGHPLLQKLIPPPDMLDKDETNSSVPHQPPTPSEDS